MRRFRTWLITAVVLVLVLLATGTFTRWVEQARELAALFTARQAPMGWRILKVPDALLSEVYVLDRDRWLTFDLPAEQHILKLLTNADLPLARRPDFPMPLPDDVKWSYAIEYQVVDNQGQVLEERTWHFQTRVSEYVDPKIHTEVTPAFYHGIDLIPTDSRSLVLNLMGLPAKPARVRVRLAEADEPLVGAAVRLVGVEEVSEHKLGYQWQRMLRERKEKLVRGNVYSLDLVTEQEYRNVLRNRPKSLAPLGIMGRDYRQRELYVLNDVEGELVRERPPPAGLLVDRDRRAVFPIPEEGGSIRLVFTPLVPHPVEDPEDFIELRWYGPKQAERSFFVVPWNGEQTIFESYLPGGVLEVKASDQMTVRGYTRAGRRASRKHLAGDTEITPERIFAWTYILEGDSSVEFEVRHTDPEATPVRVDLRRFAPEPETIRIVGPERVRGGSQGQPLTPTRVSYEMLDARGRRVSQGALYADALPSEYDRLQMLKQEHLVTDATSFYFAVPASVARIRFPPVRAPMLVSLYNRPGPLAKEARVPEDYFSFNREEIVEKGWFLLRAREHERLLAQNRVPLLAIQPRPQEDDPDILAGQYLWEEYLPPGDWRARSVLAPRDPTLVFRSEALAVTFLEMPLDREVPVRFQVAEPGRRQVTPSLVYLHPDGKPVTLKVFLDGRLHQEATVTGTRGELLLPDVPIPASGQGVRMRVAASRPLRAFLNCVDPGSGSALLKRTALEIGPAGLTFDYEKAAYRKDWPRKFDEMLSFTCFRPLGTHERTVLRIAIERTVPPESGPHLSWTFRDRLYDLKPGEQQPVPVLGTQGENFDQGQIGFFPLGSDLVPGRYRIRIERVSGPAVYLVLARTTPGAYENREFFVEYPYRIETTRDK